jgi:uncharacterized membrane protein YuzA (DUF378 family)
MPIIFTTMKTSLLKAKTPLVPAVGAPTSGPDSNKEQLMKYANVITLVLVIVGAVNWGLMGFFQLDLVATLFGGPDAALSRIVYTLVGISGLYQLVPLFSAMSGTDNNPQLATTHRH